MAVGGVPDLSDIVGITENLQAQNEEITVLESIFEGDEDRMHIVASAELENGESSTQHMLKMYIPVKCQHRLHVDVHLPVIGEVPPGETEGAIGGSMSGGEASLSRLHVARSESGQRIIFSFEVSYLPPMCLHVTLPQTYPSSDPPSFVITCVWLSPRQLTQVCQEFDRLWLDYKGDSDSPGMPILYTWLDWMQENLLKTLGIDCHISVTSHCIDEDVDDCRVVMETEDLNTIVTQMIRYNRHEEVKVFYNSEQECSICFERNMGSKFFLLPTCNHHVCQDCLSSHCQLLVKEGSVLHIRCPMYECKEYIPPYILKEVLSTEEFARFESLSLTKGLEIMGDITWCPRCNNAVIQEPEQNLNLAQCSVCFFTFCTLCMEKWHQGEKCLSAEMSEEDIHNRAVENEHNKARRVEEVRRFKQKLQNKRSNNYIHQMAKRCPHCHAPIMKTGGCNKVMCTICLSSMCFICESKITTYDHFNKSSKCSTFTFENETIDNTDIRNPERDGVPRFQNPVNHAAFEANEGMGMLIRERLKVNPDLREQTIRCCMCKQTNLKENPSNHIRCWNCKLSLCFYCKQNVSGPVGKHFSGLNACPQHTAL